jgi:hypothetical protein
MFGSHFPTANDPRIWCRSETALHRMSLEYVNSPGGRRAVEVGVVGKWLGLKAYCAHLRQMHTVRLRGYHRPRGARLTAWRT